jgi:hypothetical protein
VLVYRLLRGDFNYRDPGAHAYEDHHRARTLRNLRNRARYLGFGLLDLNTEESSSTEQFLGSRTLDSDPS